MKLSDSYSPNMYELESNILYNHFQSYFIDTFREPEERHPEREEIVKGKFVYHLSEQEREFYRTLYVQQGKLLQVTSCEMLGNVEGISEIGEHVKDLIEFVFKMPDPLALLIAPIGWGKTVLLKYVWFYLTSQSSSLAGRIRPIYIAVDHWKADIEREGGKDVIRLLEDLLQQRITRLINEEGIANLDDEEFWAFLVKYSDHFATLRQKEEDIKIIYSNSEVAKREIAKVRSQARGSRHYYYMALEYLRVQKRRVPLLLIDNVDQLRLEKDIKKILEYVTLLTREYGVKILLTLRKRTYMQISQKFTVLLAYPPIRIEMEKPKLDNYIKKRVTYVSRRIQSERKKYTYIIVGKSRISFKEAAKVYKNLLDVLLNEESQKALDFIGRSNLRSINSFILEYLSSGYVNADEIIQRITERQLLDGSKAHTIGKTPLWILLSTIITHNYKTRFSRVALERQRMDVVNLYCNGREFPGQFFTRIHVLSYIRNDHSEGTNLRELLEDYRKLFPDQKTEVEKWLRRALYKLSLYGLIDTEDCAAPSSPKDIGCLRHFWLTRTGEYYLDEFRNYYEYLVYMKDDIEFTAVQLSEYPIMDCITTESLRERFEEVTKFLHLLYDEEKKFLANLDRTQRQLYKMKFVPPKGNCFLVVHAPIETQIKFGETRKASADISEESIQRLYSLQEDLQKFCKVYE